MRKIYDQHKEIIKSFAYIYVYQAYKYNRFYYDKEYKISQKLQIKVGKMKFEQLP